MNGDMNYDEYTVDQLIEATTELNDRVDTLFTRLARIECTARGDGIAATVNLEGRLVDLTLSAQAVALPADELAAEIFRLTQEAAAAALAEGLDALTPVAGEDLTDELRALIDARPKPTVPAPPAAPAAPAVADPPRTLDDSEDFSAVETWAVPR